MATATIILPVQAAKLTGILVSSATVAQGAGIDGGDGAWKLLFDTTTAEGAVWQFKMPSNFASGLTAVNQYSMASATGGTLSLGMSVAAIADGEDVDADPASFDTMNTSAATAVQNSSNFVDTVTTVIATDDSVSADELVFYKLERRVDLDSALGDAELLSVTLQYTTT